MGLLLLAFMQSCSKDESPNVESATNNLEIKNTWKYMGSEYFFLDSGTNQISKQFIEKAVDEEFILTPVSFSMNDRVYSYQISKTRGQDVLTYITHGLHFSFIIRLREDSMLTVEPIDTVSISNQSKTVLIFSKLQK